MKDPSKTAAAADRGASALRRLAASLLVLVPMSLPCLSAGAQTSTYVPAVVASSVTTVPTTTYASPTGIQTNLKSPTEVALDACGNIYAFDHGYDGNARVTEIPAGGGAATIAYTAGNSYSLHLAQDPTHANIPVGLPYSSTSVKLVPVTNCVPNASQAKTTGGGPGALFYYYNAGHLAGDFAGNTYIATNGTCCVTGSYYLIQEVNGNGNILLSNLPQEITMIAVDMAQNVYYILGGVVYKLAYSGGKYAAAGVLYGSYLNPVGLSVDNAGNLYVADSSAAVIYEIPNEGTTGLNLADQFAVAGGVNINVPVAVNARGDMYYTAAGATAVSQLTLGYANFNSVPTGTSATRILNFQFNAAATITGIQAPSGDFTILAPAAGTTPCSTTGTYGPSATKRCQITVGFNPTKVGKESSAVVVSYTSGTTSKSISGFVEGIGQGAQLTTDPGTATQTPGTFKSPTNVAVDAAGNSYYADPGNNAVVEYPAGGGAAVPIVVSLACPSTSTMTITASSFSAPNGVAVDGAGNLFVADTGLNRIVEVPFKSGALSPAGASLVSCSVKAPASVYVHTNGDLYVADTGDNTILMYPAFNGPTNAGAVFGAPMKFGTGLSAPLAVTVDGPGNIYIADSGNNQILEYPLGGGQQIVAANILNPSAMAADSSGSLLVVDQGNYRVLRIPSVQGTLNPNSAAEIALGVAAPYGIALDASSNLYVTDKTNAAAYTIARSQAALGFGSLALGVTSTALPLTVESAGNLPLVFNSPYFTGTGNTGDFAMTSPTGACANGTTLAIGTSCGLVATFTPGGSGARSETIAFSSNAANAPQLILSGTGVPPSPTTTALAYTTAVTGAPFYGEPLTFTATITGTGTPTGVASFVVDGVQAGLLPVVKGVATLQLNSGLTGGSHTIYAVYKGDPSNNGSSSSVLTLQIAKAPTTSTLVLTSIPYNNPYSLRHSNTGSCNVTDTLGNVNYFNAVPNDPIAFTAAVTSTGVGVPSGTFTFYSDGQLINGVPTASMPVVPTSVTAVLPGAGGVFSGNMSSNANTLGDGTTLGENNVLLGPHNITVVYSGDQNYLPSTSTITQVTVVDVSPTTPVTLPQSPVSPAPYCDANSTISGSRPSDPSTYTVTASSTSVTATASTPATTTLTFNSLGGWTGVIAIACPDLPQYTTCSSNPGQAVINSSTPGSTVLPVQVALTIKTNVPVYVPTAAQSGMFWWSAVLLGLIVIFSRRRLRQLKGSVTLTLLAAAVFGGIAGLSGCGSGTANSVVTKPGSYTVHVVLTGAQYDPQAQYGHEVFRSDVPFSLPLTLTVQ